MWKQGVKVTTLSTQYGIPRSTLYYWLARSKTHHTYQRIKSIPRRVRRKVTDAVKAAVLNKRREYPKLGCWRLSEFEYENQTLSPSTIWRITIEAKPPKLPPKLLYILSRFHQLWFIDHMHLRTLPNGQKVYNLIILDGLSRVLLSDEICLSKGALDAVVLLLKAFAKWGRPEQILSDNAKAFTSLLYTLTMATLSISVRYSTPGRPWENPFAEAMVGILRVYFYPRLQHQKSIAGVQKVVTGQTGYYNQRRHWEFRNDSVQTPFGKLGTARGRPLPDNFELSVLAISKRSSRTVDGQGWISFKRYRFYVHCQLSTQRVEIRECIDSLIVIYQSRPVISYQCTRDSSEIESVENIPAFHQHRKIEPSKQLELFDLSDYDLRYVIKRPAYHKRATRADAIQLTFDEILDLKRKQ